MDLTQRQYGLLGLGGLGATSLTRLTHNDFFKVMGIWDKRVAVYLGLPESTTSTKGSTMNKAIDAARAKGFQYSQVTESWTKDYWPDLERYKVELGKAVARAFNRPDVEQLLAIDPQATKGNLPAHYLKPMTKAQIDAYIAKEKSLGVNSKLSFTCDPTWGGFFSPCFIAILEIERANLYFVNGFITHDQLKEAYDKSFDLMSIIPRFPKFKHQLKVAAEGAIAAVAGFFTMGPVGIFIGLSTVAAKEYQRGMQERVDFAYDKLNPIVQQAQDAYAERERIELRENILRWALIAGGTATVGGVLYWMFKS